MDSTFPRSEALGDTARQNNCAVLKMSREMQAEMQEK